jgi:acyl-coenzyme A thioesterase PaaI-like protein
VADLPEAARIRVRDDHHCFGCGRLNPHGLHMHFYQHDGGVMAPFTPERRHEGYTGVVHGGIITTVLDEVMAWALYAKDIWAVTGDIRVRFRRPVAVGVAAYAVGKIGADRGRVLEVTGELRRAADDALLADATASFVRVPRDQAEAWQERYVGTDTAT